MIRGLLLSMVVLVAAGSALGDEYSGPSEEALAWARETVKKQLPDAPRADEFPADRTWLNVRRPLTLEGDLRGKVVLLDFWCYCCINCMHVLPDLEILERKYAGEPFAVVGVHSAKFTSEKDAENIRQAVLRYEIHHPVVNDDDFRIWRSFGATSWPTFALVTPDGHLLGGLSGEGNLRDLDALIQATLEHYRKTKPDVLDARSLPIRLERTQVAPTQLAYPGKLYADAASKRLYIADSDHNRIVETDLDGHFQRAFGSGGRGFQDGPAAQARFFRPQGLAVHAGALWVCDTENHAIRRVDLRTGKVVTVAGTGKQGTHWKRIHPKRGVLAHGPWPGLEVALNSPWDILFVGDTGYIAMAGSHSLWTIDAKTHDLRHFAGDLTERRLDADDPYTAAFAQPSGLAFDGKDLYVADSESSAILRVTLEGAVTTLAGASDDPRDLFHFGDEDGVGKGRRFQHPLGVLFHDGLLYVADSYNHKIKTLDPKTHAVRTLFAKAPGYMAKSADSRLAEPGGLAAAGDVLYVANTNRHQVLQFSFDGLWGRPLGLRDVPIPARHAHGGIGAAWPELPGTVFLGLPEQAVSAGEEIPLGVRVSLPDGWKLTEGAPAAVRLEVGGTVHDAKLEHGEAMLRVPRLPAGRHTVVVRLLYYLCREGRACSVRSVHWRFLVNAGPRGRQALVLTDLYVPW